MTKTLKQLLVTILIDILILGIVSFGVEKYLLPQLDSLAWWQYLIILGAVALLTLFVWLVIYLASEVSRTRSIKKYLTGLVEKKNKNSGEYLPLSYKINDGSLTRYSLEQLLELPKNANGFVLYADAGYGKTWSIEQLAGEYAEKALAKKHFSKNPIPVLIKMGEVKDKTCTLAQIISLDLFADRADGLKKATELLEKRLIVLFVDGMDEANVEVREAISTELAKYINPSTPLTIIGGTREETLWYFPESLPKFSIWTLLDKQVHSYIDKVITDPSKNRLAKHYYFEKTETNFLQELRTPFYLKTFVKFVIDTGTPPESANSMIRSFVEATVRRELDKKNGFHAKVATINELLTKLAKYLGKNTSAEKNTALKYLKESLEYDAVQQGSIPAIAERLDSMDILHISAAHGSGEQLIRFAHKNYHLCYLEKPDETDMVDYD